MISVMFATYNGSGTLPLVLESFAQLRAPEQGWKCIAVDNGSSDDTYEILRSWEGFLPLEVLYEPRPGKNAALNRALVAVDGEFVVITDDDVLPFPDWLLRYEELIKSREDVDVFGGPILPQWECAPPAFVLKPGLMGPLFALKSPDLPEGPSHPSGPNMAVRMRVFDDGFRFNEGIGPMPSSQYAMGSETEFLSRLEGFGYKFWFSRAPCVFHIIPKEHLKIGWMLQRAKRLGRGRARLTILKRKKFGDIRKIFGVPQWLVRRYVELTLLILTKMFRRECESRFELRWQRNVVLGEILEWRGFHKECKHGRTKL